MDLEGWADRTKLDKNRIPNYIKMYQKQVDTLLKTINECEFTLKISFIDEYGGIQSITVSPADKIEVVMQ